VVKDEGGLTRALEKLEELRGRYARVTLSDTGMWTNQTLSWTRAVGDMLKLADPILRGSLERRESRGSHYRSDYLERDDGKFLATTVAEYDASSGRSTIRFEDVEVGLVKPRVRDYSKTGKAGPAAASDPKAAPRVSDAKAEPDINGKDPTQSGVGTGAASSG
jgi:succinate dehydrogenase / fumarate reductase flavoprotein subunit